jgi:phosphoribosylformimino-5-aminoimidazole carboxamide ribotide isomerase
VDWPWWVWLLAGLWWFPGAIWCTVYHLRMIRSQVEHYRAFRADPDWAPLARSSLRHMVLIHTLTYLIMLVVVPPFYLFGLLADREARKATRRHSPRFCSPRIIPVLDLLKGQVVRGVGGRREEYRPIVSCLTTSAEPRAVAYAFWKHFSLLDLYLADLDAIAGAPPAVAIYRALKADHFHLWVDAGIRQPEDARPLAEAGVRGLVAGLETLSGPEALRTLCQTYGSDRVIFSLDLKGGRPLTGNSAWQGTDARSIAEEAIACGVRRLIVLDLERVGVGEGTGTEDFCAALKEAHPGLEIIAGGGVRDAADLRRLKKCGVSAVLVASALHDGRLTREDLETL